LKGTDPKRIEPGRFFDALAAPALGASVATLTNQRFLYLSLRESVSIDLSSIDEIHLANGWFWRLFIFVHRSDGEWFRFRVTSYGGWQRAFHELKPLHEFKLT
jgi:hypothetical protein